jgi:hypothetical protein
MPILSFPLLSGSGRVLSHGSPGGFRRSKPFAAIQSDSSAHAQQFRSIPKRRPSPSLFGRIASALVAPEIIAHADEITRSEL